MESDIRSLARGETVRDDLLLPGCRAAAFGMQIYGGEEILHALAEQPMSGEGDWISAPGHAVLASDRHALVADLSGEHIARLWRLGPDTPRAREPAVDVPFDPDMTQMTGVPALRAADHDVLAERDAPRIADVAAELAAGWRDPDGRRPSRVRPFCLRAFSSAEACVALFAVHLIEGGEARTAGFVHAGAIVDAAGARIFKAEAEEAAMRARQWRPRVD